MRVQVHHRQPQPDRNKNSPQPVRRKPLVASPCKSRTSRPPSLPSTTFWPPPGSRTGNVNSPAGEAEPPGWETAWPSGTGHPATAGFAHKTGQLSLSCPNSHERSPPHKAPHPSGTSGSVSKILYVTWSCRKLPLGMARLGRRPDEDSRITWLIKSITNTARSKRKDR